MTRPIEAGNELHSCWPCGLVFDSFGNADRVSNARLADWGARLAPLERREA